MLKSLASSLILLFTINLVLAETAAIVTEENQAKIFDDGLGVELRFNQNGELLFIKSTSHHPIEFPGRQGIIKAYIIAEEKAKANIARFINQEVTTIRITTELDESKSRYSRTSSSTDENWSKDNSRKVSESLKEITTSRAIAILKGIRLIDRTYDEKNEEVMVVIGINKSSQSQAIQLQNSFGN